VGRRASPESRIGRSPRLLAPRVGQLVRTFLIALGLATIVLGLFLLFAGYVHIGCTVGGSSSDPTFSNCGGATDLEIAGAVLTIAAVLMFVGSLVPYTDSREP